MQKGSALAKKTNRSVCISETNELSFVESKTPTTTGTVIFSNERELSLRTAEWPSSRLVAIWNKLPQVKRVRKFTDRRTAIRRIWRAIQKERTNRTIALNASNLSSKETGRPNTKTAQIINLLRQPAGATLQSIMDLTGWQAHSIRGFISAELWKKRGLRVESFTRDGERVYLIRG
jgi:hypothetical protein